MGFLLLRRLTFDLTQKYPKTSLRTRAKTQAKTACVCFGDLLSM
ncbi:MAG: hypothetical protein WCG25_02415 [bacterium]